MKTFLVDFNRVINNPEDHITHAVQLGFEHLEPETQGLHDGEEVIVFTPGELWMKAHAIHCDDERGRYWYAELFGPAHYYDEEGGPEPVWEREATTDSQSAPTGAQ